MKEVRTRFAPSPTGYIHIGNLRSAIFPWLLAKQNNGKFILRIEDTDQARFVDGATELMLDVLRWLGIDWDEGPQKGGPYGPYVQTERLDRYQFWAKKLIDKGLAYADPYTKEELDKFRQQSTKNKKAFLYRDYRPDNPPNWDGSQPLRFKVTDIKRYHWHDEVMGDLTAGPEALDDFILIKSDGLPTYNFAHIIDDYEMKISHVIRGLEYIPSIPKYLALYEALNIEQPKLACLPHVMAPDGNKKLGKRDGAKSAQDYRQDGILPEALLNFLASLGWNDGTEQEVFSKDELVTKFELNRVQKSGARFDEKRLIWMNGQWIRRLPLDDLYSRTVGFWPTSAEATTDEDKKKVLSIVQDRLKTLADLPSLTSYFFEEPKVDIMMIKNDKQLGKLANSELKNLLEKSIETLKKSDFKPDELQDVLNNLLIDTGQKPIILFSLIRIALSWAPFSPALNETLAVLGKNESIRRLEKALKNI